MTAAGAKYVASLLTGNPPLEILVIPGGLACVGSREHWVGEMACVTTFALRQATLTWATTG